MSVVSVCLVAPSLRSHSLGRDSPKSRQADLPANSLTRVAWANSPNHILHESAPTRAGDISSALRSQSETGKDAATDATMLKATNTIYHDQQHPSALILPVVGR